MFTITYRHGPHENPDGSLLEGGTVKIKNEWCSMSRQLISRSVDLQRLREEGYDLEIRAGFCW